MIKYPLIIFGPFPYELVNRTLGTELEPGDAVLTARAHRHIAIDHASEYPVIIANLESVVLDPGYIGQSPNHGDEFEMVRRVWVPGGKEIVLAALNLTRNDFGNYSIHSAYCLSEEKVTARLLKKHLFLPKK